MRLVWFHRSATVKLLWSVLRLMGNILGSGPIICPNTSLASAMWTRRPRSRRDTPLAWFTRTLIRGGNHFASHISVDCVSRWMGSFSCCKLTLMRRLLRDRPAPGSPCSHGSLRVNYLENNDFLQMGLEPIVLGALSYWKLKVPGSFWRVIWV